tara:strand:+ start:271 stop:798 length:528 start_codon:yes stop_codon:yes gene_type:complete
MKAPEDIIKLTDCICFHETDLPYGRGGSPIQNLIARGHKHTKISALKMSNQIDEGPIYLKKYLSLEGLGDDIFIRAAKTIGEMIKIIITENLKPSNQRGEAEVFYRRTESQSEISPEIKSLNGLFDHIRMFDIETYPKAYINIGEFRYELSRPALKTNEIIADIKITKINKDSSD